MIGNDIVDLRQASVESNWKRPRFLDKVFTEKEQQLIAKAENQLQMVWLLWSMKEASYKVYVQQFNKQFFNPKKLHCNLFYKAKGSVSIGENMYITKSNSTENYIYTIALLEEKEHIKSNYFKVEETSYQVQHKDSYRAVLKMFSELKKVPIDDIEIKKNRLGVPKLFQNNKEQRVSFSLTHHGNYCGWAIYY